MLATAIARFLNDLRVRHDVVLSVLPDLAARIYLINRDEDQLCDTMARRFTLPVADAQSRIADALFGLTGLTCWFQSTLLAVATRLSQRHGR